MTISDIQQSKGYVRLGERKWSTKAQTALSACNQLVAKITYWEHQQLSRLHVTTTDSSSSDSDFEPILERDDTQPKRSADQLNEVVGDGSLRSVLEMSDDPLVPGSCTLIYTNVDTPGNSCIL